MPGPSSSRWSSDAGGPPPPTTFIPPPPPPPLAPERDGPAWEQRSGILDFVAMFRTVAQVLFNAPATFASMVREGGLGGPIVYLVFLGTVFGWIALMWTALSSAAFGNAFDPTAFGDLDLPFMSPEIQAQGRLIYALMLPAVVLVFYFIWSGIVHLMLLLLGGSIQSFETTARVMAYSWGSASVFNALPFCGGIIGGVWNVVAQIIGLSRAHEISGGKAAAAVLLPLVLCCLCAVGGVVAVSLMIGSQL